MLDTRKRTLLAEAALLLAGLIWGSGFVVMKNTLSALPINWLLALRFLIAAILLCAVLWRKVIRANKAALIAGGVCGVLLYLAYYMQTAGLQFTTAGNNAFLTAVYVVLVPFLHWAVSKKSPGPRAVIAGCLCLAGVGVIALQSNFTVNTGDALTLLCGVLYALHIMAVSRFTRQGVDVLLLTALQFVGTTVCAATVGLVFEPFPAALVLLAPETFLSLLYLGIGCTLLALLLQNIGLRFAPPSHASLLMSTEAPFGFLFGIIFLAEPFTLRFALGAGLIAGSIVLSELGQKQQAPLQVKEEGAVSSAK